jgi:hypothetical protein
MTDRHLDSYNESRKFKITPTGYWTGDVAPYHTTDPGLAEWIATYLDPNEQVYDLGCGAGGYLAHLARRKFSFLLGYDGEVAPDRHFGAILPHDLTTPLSVTPGNVICLEVGEHVPAQHESALLDNITRACAKVLILSWAVRGQWGDGHVNLKDNGEVIPLVCMRGFEYLAAESARARESVASLPWLKNTVMVFRRRA